MKRNCVRCQVKEICIFSDILSVFSNVLKGFIPTLLGEKTSMNVTISTNVQTRLV